MKNFVPPHDPHIPPRSKDVPVIVFKSKEKKEKNEIIKAEKPVEKPSPSMIKQVVQEVKPRTDLKSEGEEKAIIAEKPVEKKVEVTKKKIRFEKGSPEAMQFGKEMALRRKLKKEGLMKEKVVEVREKVEEVKV
jgi:hypothetical protein